MKGIMILAATSDHELRKANGLAEMSPLSLLNPVHTAPMRVFRIKTVGPNWRHHAT
jgi:hypothetical protein